jgi:hypothetical protein
MRKVIGSNSIFVEPATDALGSNCYHWRVVYFDSIKIRRASALGGSTPIPGTIDSKEVIFIH